MRIIFIVIATATVLFATSSCKKYQKNDIVETDANGNIISSNGSNDWQEQDYYSDQSYTTGHMFLCSGIFYNFEGPPECVDYIICNSNIANDISFSFYPNPVPKNGEATLEINSSKNILGIAYGDKLKRNKSVTETRVPLVLSDQNNIAIKMKYSDFQFTYNQDFELYVTVLTEDSCYYFTKGKIKWGK